MDVCECIVPLWHETLNNRRATSPLVRFVKRKERWEIPDLSSGCLPQNWGGTNPNRIVSYMVLKVTDNNGFTPTPHHDEFLGPRSDVIVNQVTQVITTQSAKTDGHLLHSKAQFECFVIAKV
ncbi:uncharacterized protein TNCV_3778471 [Trichonephila clavipes]|nr:uncharacterized protein TNCV_3778471 [Trichonephila clavipes]